MRNLLDESLLANVLQSMNEGVLLFSTSSGQLTHFNSSACKILNLDPEQMLSLNKSSPNITFFDETLTPINFSDLKIAETLKKDHILGVSANGNPIQWVKYSTSIIPAHNPSDPLHLLVTFQQMTKEYLQNKVKFCLADIREKFMEDVSDIEFFQFLTQQFLNVSESYFGFLQVVAHSNLQHHDSTIYTYTTAKIKGDPLIRAQSIIQKKKKEIESGEIYIKNNIQSASHLNGTEHLVLLPIYSGKQKIAVIGLTDRIGGYQWSFLSELTPLIGVTSDLITQRYLKSRHSEILTSLGHVADNYPGIFWIADLEGRFQLVSEPFAKVHKKKKKDFIGKRQEDILDKDQLRLVQQNNSAVLKKKESVTYSQTYNGRQYRTIKFPILDSHGNVAALAGMSEDSTDLEAAKKELEQQRKLFAHKSRLASIGELAAGVGHEINNPLAIAMGMLSLSKFIMEEDSFDKEKILAHMDKIDRAHNRIKKIVAGLRTFSRSDSNELSVYSVSSALNETLSLVTEIYKKDGIQLNFSDFHSHDVLIYGNRGRMQQVILNLLSNARDATEGQNYRQITVRTYSREDNKFEFCITDNGCGIDAKLIEKVFDPFFSTKEVNLGTGIGLSLANNIVTEHGGEISVKSKVNEGTTFVVTLPISEGTQRVEQSEVTDTPQIFGLTKGMYHALIVDDEPEVMEILGRALGDLGIKTTIAPDGESAFQLFLSHDFDFIFSEIKVPRMSGPELLTKVRDQTTKKQPKIFFVTGSVDIPEQDEDQYFELGLDGYVFKPFNDLDLQQCLSQHLATMENLTKAS